MRWLAVAIGLVVTAIGILGMAAPAILLDTARLSVTPLGLYVVAALRVAFGLVLIRVAPISRAPRAFRILGAFIVVAGIITPFLGIERARAILEWWTAQGTVFFQISMALPVIFGLFIVYAVAPRRRAA